MRVTCSWKVLPTAALLALAAPLLYAQDLARGSSIFLASCARCHGVEGTGGEGPTLNRQTLENAPDDESLREVIRTGLPGTDMPGTRYLNENDVAAVAVYVRSLGTREPEDLPGDADHGRDLFFDRGACDTCHIIDGVGDSLGPDLTKVGARRGSNFLREHVRDPSDAVPESHLMVRVKTKDGAQLEGMRVNEDAFSIQLRDSENQFHSFLKSDLELLAKLVGRSMMPRYDRRLDEDEIEDLVAYLATLRGDR